MLRGTVPCQRPNGSMYSCTQSCKTENLFVHVLYNLSPYLLFAILRYQKAEFGIVWSKIKTSAFSSEYHIIFAIVKAIYCTLCFTIFFFHFY
ncbi:hypothetical protein BJ165DRAFT_1457791 [Panaeolus papilionaceus]|nr:hypothetical protein BJ165DRAFT_1457791 [Panaeolus papilionaceus]